MAERGGGVWAVRDRQRGVSGAAFGLCDADPALARASRPRSRHPQPHQHAARLAWLAADLVARDDRALHAGAADARSEEHAPELQSQMRNSYAVLCFKKNNNTQLQHL